MQFFSHATPHPRTWWGTAARVVLASSAKGVNSVAMAKRKFASTAPSFTPDDDVIQEFLCPITQELPIEPCYAKDGHVYDQWALEKWMDTVKEATPVLGVAINIHT